MQLVAATIDTGHLNLREIKRVVGYGLGGDSGRVCVGVCFLCDSLGKWILEITSTLKHD